MRSTEFRWASGPAIATGVALLFAAPAPAARDPAPTVSTDPAAHVVAVTGPHHRFKPVLNLIRTDWWLHATIEAGVPGDPMLMFGVDLPGWAGLDSATDASGAKLAVAVLARGRSPDLHGENAERVAITLPRALAEKAAATGLTVTVAGKLRAFPIAVPGPAIRAFLAGYDAAIIAAQLAPAAPPPAAAAAAPAAPEQPPASPDETPAASAPSPDTVISAPVPVATAPMPASPTTATAPPQTAAPDADAGHPSDEFPVASLGIVIEPSAYGAMLLSVTHDSRLAALGVAEGDFIAGVDGKSIKGLSGAQMAARIGAPGVKVLNCIADGDVTIR